MLLEQCRLFYTTVAVHELVYAGNFLHISH